MAITDVVRVPGKRTRAKPGRIAALTANPESPPMAPLAIRSVLREDADLCFIVDERSVSLNLTLSLFCFLIEKKKILIHTVIHTV